MAEDESGDSGRETRRLNSKKQSLEDAYAAPANFLEIDVGSPQTHGLGRNRYTDYEVRMRVWSWSLCLVAFLFYTTLVLMVGPHRGRRPCVDTIACVHSVRACAAGVE